MERISKKRRAKSEKPQFPKLRSKYGVTHSFRFSLRAWFNFKLYALVLLALIALAVITFTKLEPADYSGEKFTDAFYTFDENIAEDGATSQSPVRMVGGHDIVLLAEEHEHTWTKIDEDVIEEGDCDTEEVVKITEKCSCGEIRITTETKDVVHTPVYSEEEGMAPTCDTDGYYYEVYTCECGTVTAKVQKTIPALGHVSRAEAEKVEVNREEPTCTEAGYIKVDYVCTREGCGAVIETTIVTLGAAHKLEAVTDITKKATCTEKGAVKVVLECTVCDYVEPTEDSFELNALGHDFSVVIEGKEAKAPTCESDGLTAGTKCSRCDEITEQEKISALGHNFGICTNNKCLNENCEYTRVAGQHTYEKFVIESKAPTCTEAGYEVYYEKKCTSCGHIENEEKKRTELEALGHTGAATCLEDFACANEGCEYKEKATGHHDKNGDWYCDTCRLALRDLNPMALLYTICLVGVAVAAIWFLILTIMLIVTAFKVSSMRLEFYDEVVVWRWGRVFKRHIEQRFIGVYDVLVMPRNKLYYKESVEKTKPAKFGTVLAKVPGGGYEWNRKFFGVKEYIQLKNYLESKKITERFERPRSNFHDDSI